MFVYVISEPGASLVKIGRATNVASRLSGLRTGSPVDLVLRAQWDGDADDEKRLHGAFADKRVRGEWFEFGDATDPVEAVTSELGRQPVQATRSKSEPAPEPRKRRKVDALPTVEDMSRYFHVYRAADGQVVSERTCMNTCVGPTMVWGPGHKHEMVMSEEQYEEFGPAGPLLGNAAAL